MKEKILLMFSGGLDSTACLYKLLTEKEYQEYDLHVHHIHLINKENRWRAEQIAVHDILHEVRNYRPYKPLEFTVSTYEYLICSNRVFLDLFYYALAASSLVFNDQSITKIAVGRNHNDAHNFHMATPAYTPIAQMLFKNVLACHNRHLKPEYIFPIEDLSKQAVYEYLPSRLRDLTWSCRYPIYINQNTAIECEVCPTCKSLKSIRGRYAQTTK